MGWFWSFVGHHLSYAKYCNIPVSPLEKTRNSCHGISKDNPFPLILNTQYKPWFNIGYIGYIYNIHSWCQNGVHLIVGGWDKWVWQMILPLERTTSPSPGFPMVVGSWSWPAIYSVPLPQVQDVVNHVLLIYSYVNILYAHSIHI
jgi:hypothetical protein